LPRENICLLQIDEFGKSYKSYKLSDNQGNISPASELPTHLSIHNMLAKTNSKEKVVIHAHPNELIALTQSADFHDEKKLNNIFLNIHPEQTIL
jgi:rhamnulose-1-phosphate aldolase